MTSYEALDRLGMLQSRYSNKRSVAYGLLREVTDLATQAITEAEKVAKARADGRIAQVERQHEFTQRTLDTLRARNKQLEELFAEKRRLNEEREESGEEVQVRIGRSLGGSWLIGDLEEIVYRMRCGGATDETPVKITDYTATAKVVAPELVPLVRPSEAKVDRTPPSFAPDMDIVAKPLANPDRAIVLVALAVMVLFVLFDVARWIL